MTIIKMVVILKTHGQISKKHCVEKYCSCDKLCQFSMRKKCPYSELFASFVLNMERYFVSLCIESECRKYRPE